MIGEMRCAQGAVGASNNFVLVSLLPAIVDQSFNEGDTRSAVHFFSIFAETCSVTTNSVVSFISDIGSCKEQRRSSSSRRGSGTARAGDASEERMPLPG